MKRRSFLRKTVMGIIGAMLPGRLMRGSEILGDYELVCFVRLGSFNCSLTDDSVVFKLNTEVAVWEYPKYRQIGPRLQQFGDKLRLLGPKF